MLLSIKYLNIFLYIHDYIIYLKLLNNTKNKGRRNLSPIVFIHKYFHIKWYELLQYSYKSLL